MSSASFYAAKGQSEWLRTRHRLVQGDSLQSTATEEERKGITHHFLTTPAHVAPEDDSVGQNGSMPNPQPRESNDGTHANAFHVTSYAPETGKRRTHFVLDARGNLYAQAN